MRKFVAIVIIFLPPSKQHDLCAFIEKWVFIKKKKKKLNYH